MLKEAFEILSDFGAESLELLKERHLAAGQKASGNYLESLKAEVKDVEGSLRLTITGAEHSEYTDRGRGPGGSWKFLYVKFLEWGEQKGLKAHFGKAFKTRMYFAAKLTAEQGTFHHRTGKTFTGGMERPISGVFEEMRMKKLNEKISASLHMIIQSEIIKQFKQ